MKLVIFAGGKGTRLWPLSRVNSPKQFDAIFNGKSTLQLALDRVAPVFGLENIFIQTIKPYENIVREQVPELPLDNLLIEPDRKNLGPAVCFATLELKKRGFNDAMAILWADHLMEKPLEFAEALKAGHELIKTDPERFVFLGEKPRFSNNNLGWIKVGKEQGNINDKAYFSFQGWKYKPEQVECDQMYASGQFFWNPGYFITSVDFLLARYQELAPETYTCVCSGNYSQAEAIHFDRAIIEKVDLSKAVVLKTDMGWTDPGTLYALKKALEEHGEANVIQGKVSLLNTKDSLLYNLDKNKILTGVGLNGMVVINTPDALIVVPKEEVINVTSLVKQMQQEGLEEYL